MTTAAQERELQNSILDMLTAVPSGLTVPEIADSLDDDRHRIYHALTVMHDAGLVIYTVDRVWSPGRPPHRYRLLPEYL